MSWTILQKQAFDAALRWAMHEHFDHEDKGGLPYILHCMAVASQGETWLECIVGMLHDIVEDTCQTQADQVEMLSSLEHHFGEQVRDAVDAITLRPGETRQEYIDRCVQNDTARQVKKYDLKHNADPRRMARVKDEQTRERLHAKHKQYWEAIWAYEEETK